MCGRYASFLPPEALRAIFHTANPLPNAAPTWNMAPTQDALVVRRHPQTGERHLDVLRWGLIPRTAKDVKGDRTNRPINARAETVTRNSLFRDSFARRRCLVPAGAFYEWRTTPDGKQPFAVARADGAPLALAGLWSGWTSPETGEVIRSCAIITTAANATMRALHDRMPMIVEEADWPIWLGEGEGDPAALLRPAAEGVLRLWPVSRAVNSVRNNSAELLDRTDDSATLPPTDARTGETPF